jgi:hypothetical protein
MLYRNVLTLTKLTLPIVAAVRYLFFRSCDMFIFYHHGFTVSGTGTLKKILSRYSWMYVFVVMIYYKCEIDHITRSMLHIHFPHSFVYVSKSSVLC